MGMCRYFGEPGTHTDASLGIANPGAPTPTIVTSRPFSRTLLPIVDAAELKRRVQRSYSHGEPLPVLTEPAATELADDEVVRAYDVAHAIDPLPGSERAELLARLDRIASRRESRRPPGAVPRR